MQARRRACWRSARTPTTSRSARAGCWRGWRSEGAEVIDGGGLGADAIARAHRARRRRARRILGAKLAILNPEQEVPRRGHPDARAGRADGHARERHAARSGDHPLGARPALGPRPGQPRDRLGAAPQAVRSAGVPVELRDERADSSARSGSASPTSPTRSTRKIEAIAAHESQLRAAWTWSRRAIWRARWGGWPASSTPRPTKSCGCGSEVNATPMRPCRPIRRYAHPAAAAAAAGRCRRAPPRADLRGAARPPRRAAASKPSSAAGVRSRRSRRGCRHDDAPGALMAQLDGGHAFDEHARARWCACSSACASMQRDGAARRAPAPLDQLKLVVQLEHSSSASGSTRRSSTSGGVDLQGRRLHACSRVIVLALVSYLGANVFYWFSSSWIEPTVISPTDERVLALSTQLASSRAARDKVAADLADAERVIAMQEEFLDGAQQGARRRAGRSQERARPAGRAQPQLRVDARRGRASNRRAYSGMSRKRIAAEYSAHFIDREAAVSGALQLSQIAQGNLSWPRRRSSWTSARAELSRETEALGGASSAPSRPGAHSYRGLAHRAGRQARRGRAGQGARQPRRAAEEPRALRQDGEDHRRLAVPARRRAARTRSRSCPTRTSTASRRARRSTAAAIGPFFCKQRRPGGGGACRARCRSSIRCTTRMLRGQPVQVQLADAHAAERKVLFAGGRPILF